MSEERHNLTKSESDRLNRLLSVAQMQQEIFDSVTQSYKIYILDIFKRLGVEESLFKHSKVDLNNGELIITTPDEPKKVQATGKEKNGN